MTVDFSSLFPPDQPTKMHPIAAVHRIEWDGWHWLGATPEPGNVLVLDTGTTDMLSEDGYRAACRIAGDYPRVIVIGSGEGVASVQRCLAMYRGREAAA